MVKEKLREKHFLHFFQPSPQLSNAEIEERLRRQKTSAPTVELKPVLKTGKKKYTDKVEDSARKTVVGFFQVNLLDDFLAFLMGS